MKILKNMEKTWKIIKNIERLKNPGKIIKKHGKTLKH